jgi:hypothetical protein
MATTSIASQSYSSRIANFSKNEAAKALLETMERKRTNLCVSVDVTKKQDLLDVVKAVSGVVALVKVSLTSSDAYIKSTKRCLISVQFWSLLDPHRHC